LTVTEIQCALSVEPGDTSLDEDVLPDIESLISSCAGIVIIDKESHIVRFVHYTFQEYILRQPSLLLVTVHVDIARTCLTYLLFEVFSTGRCALDEVMDVKIAENPLLLYASKNWGKHALGDAESDVKIQALIMRLLEDRRFRDSRLQAVLLPINRYEKYSWAIPKHVPGLWLATKFGLYTICKLMLRNGYLVNEETSEGSIALHAAADLGWFNIVALLVECGGSISGSTNLDSDAIPLLEASRNGHQYVIELLLDRGADINIKSRSGRTALHKAVGNSKEEVANLLINRGVDVTAQTKSSLWTALHSAASQGNVRPVFVLLGHGAYLDAKTSEEETSLEIAIDRGHDAVAQQLVTAGSDIHSRNRRGDLPLHLAAAKGLYNLCSEIIARGCEMNAGNYMGQTPLHKAAECNCLQVVEILLRQQAQSAVVDCDRALPLHLAAWNGHIRIVEALISSSTDINSATYLGKTCLHGASANGHTNVVRLLLEKGADPTLTRIPEPIAVISAIDRNQDNPAKRQILEKMASKSSNGKTKLTALEDTVESSHSDIIAILSDWEVKPRSTTSGLTKPEAIKETAKATEPMKVKNEPSFRYAK